MKLFTNFLAFDVAYNLYIFRKDIEELKARIRELEAEVKQAKEETVAERNDGQGLSVYYSYPTTDILFIYTFMLNYMVVWSFYEVMANRNYAPLSKIDEVFLVSKVESEAVFAAQNVYYIELLHTLTYAQNLVSQRDTQL